MSSDSSTSADRAPGRRLRKGDLVRTLSFHAGVVATYRYGTVINTKHPMRDDPNWIDCRVFWLDNGEETHEWYGELELIDSELSCPEA